MICYDYEPIYALGYMLGGSDADGFLKLMDRIEVVGYRRDECRGDSGMGNRGARKRHHL